MTWELVLQIFVIMGMACMFGALLLCIRDGFISSRRNEAIEKVVSAVTEQYLPKAMEMEIEVTDRVMDKLCDKIPDMMVKVTESTMKLTEEMDY